MPGKDLRKVKGMGEGGEDFRKVRAWVRVREKKGQGRAGKISPDELDGPPDGGDDPGDDNSGDSTDSWNFSNDVRWRFLDDIDMLPADGLEFGWCQGSSTKPIIKKWGF